ncbi:hypothetical protein ACFLT3_02120 [Chloroflexota bacterium]
MPKGSRQTVVKGATNSRVKKSRKKRQIARHPAPPPTKQILQTSNKKGASLAHVTANIQQVPLQSHVLPDLKRISIISGAMIVVLVILYLVL